MSEISLTFSVENDLVYLKKPVQVTRTRRSAVGRLEHREFEMIPLFPSDHLGDNVTEEGLVQAVAPLMQDLERRS